MDRAPSAPTTSATNPDGPPRIWPAILALYVMAPVIGEVLSLNTPPLTFLLNPSTLIFEPALYGSGALLIREIARRRGLGWRGILLLGAAYGVVEEGLAVQTWFIPSGVDTYGRAFGVNWVWAAGLTIFHAVFSVTIPILLVEAIFPRVADRPWLTRAGRWVFGLWYSLPVVFGAIAWGFFLHRNVGYTHPPLAYLGAVLLALLFAWLGLRARDAKPTADAPAQSSSAQRQPLVNSTSVLATMPPPTPLAPAGPISAAYPYPQTYLYHPMAVAPAMGAAPVPGAIQTTARRSRRPPGLWALRLAGFVGTLAYLVAFYGLGALGVPAPIVIVAIAAVAALAAWRVVRWSARPGWGAAERLALGSGALAIWLAITPVGLATGLPVVGLAFLALLIWLAWRT